MRIQKHHAHADTRYKSVSLIDFILIIRNIVSVKRNHYKTLNIHIPYELQHFDYYTNIQQRKALFFVYYVEFLKKVFKIKLYWENAPMLEYGQWHLKCGQTKWDRFPKNLELCLDTGHLMLGSKSVKEARNRIKNFLAEKGDNIKHLHLHENDLEHDDHLHPSKVINKSLFQKLTYKRTYIIEKPDSS